MSSPRWIVFIFDADGDMSAGEALGTYRSPEAADRVAQTVLRRDSAAVAIVAPLFGDSPTVTIDRVMNHA